MTDATVTPTPASKPRSKTAASPTHETPRFEAPKFEMPTIEIPAAFREIAEKGVAQARENYEKMKSVAEEATDVLEDTYTTAARGASSYGLKVIEHARANSDAAFDLMTRLMTAKSYAEVIELSSSFVRQQFDAFTAQARDLADTAQKVAADTAEPIKQGFTSALKKAA